MKAMRFFFYGTLIAGGGNPSVAKVHEHLQLLGSASARGRLYAVPDAAGWYPALLPGPGEIHGQVYAAAAGFRHAHLALLDNYEDCDPMRPSQSLYLRKPIAVLEADGGGCRAHGYLYNRLLPRGSRRIAGGHFGQWLASHGGKPFAGR